MNRWLYNIQLEESATYMGSRISLQLFCNMLQRSTKWCEGRSVILK